MNTFQQIDEAQGVPLLFAYVSETGHVMLEEFADAFLALDLDNRGAVIGDPLQAVKTLKKREQDISECMGTSMNTCRYNKQEALLHRLEPSVV